MAAESFENPVRDWSGRNENPILNEAKAGFAKLQ